MKISLIIYFQNSVSESNGYSVCTKGVSGFINFLNKPILLNREIKMIMKAASMTN